MSGTSDFKFPTKAHLVRTHVDIRTTMHPTLASMSKFNHRKLFNGSQLNTRNNETDRQIKSY